MELNGSINYNVCNVGSVVNTNNSTTCNMSNRSRFSFFSGSYTAIPAYVIGNSYNTFLHPSPDSSGRCTSILANWYYYPAISTYGIKW